MAFPTQSPAGNSAPFAGPGAEPASNPPVKDPAVNLLDEIQQKLDQLRGLLSESATTEGEGDEFELQTDEEVMAGLPPRKRVPGGQPSVI